MVRAGGLYRYIIVRIGLMPTTEAQSQKYAKCSFSGQFHRRSEHHTSASSTRVKIIFVSRIKLLNIVPIKERDCLTSDARGERFATGAFPATTASH